jgi:hypothetical protein
MMAYTRPFRHDTLFSSYYLERLLPQDEAWRIAAAEVTQALSKLKGHDRTLAEEFAYIGNEKGNEVADTLLCQYFSLITVSL